MQFYSVLIWIKIIGQFTRMVAGHATRKMVNILLKIGRQSEKRKLIKDQVKKKTIF